MIQLQVNGMSCGHCMQSVTKAAKTIDEKASVVGSVETGKVDINSDLPPEQFKQAIREQGYDVSQRKGT